MNRIHSIAHLLCLSIVAMGCPTVGGRSTLKPVEKTESTEDGNTEFQIKRRKIGVSPSPEQDPKQDLEQDLEQTKKLPINDEKSQEETTPGTRDMRSFAATSDTGSNTGAFPPTSACSRSKKDTAVSTPTVSTPTTSLLSENSHEVPADVVEKAKNAVEKAKNDVAGYARLAEQAEKGILRLKLKPQKLLIEEVQQRVDRNDAAYAYLKAKITDAQELVNNLGADHPEFKSFQEVLTTANTTLENAKTKFDATANKRMPKN